MISIFTYLKVKMAFAEPLIRMNSDHVLGNEVINVDIISKYIKYINTIVGSKIFLKMTNLYNCLKTVMTMIFFVLLEYLNFMIILEGNQLMAGFNFRKLYSQEKPLLQSGRRRWKCPS